MSTEARINGDPPLDVMKTKEKTVVLDLDRTLIYSSDEPLAVYDFIATIPVTEQTWYVRKRPGVDEFLSKVSKMYEVVVFTAGTECYASPILDILDPEGRISHRFYRDSCTIVEGHHVKDLSKIERDFKRVVIVDDKKISYSLQPDNGILISEFKGDVNDTELEKVGEFLNWCYTLDDLRVGVSLYPYLDQLI